MMMTTIYAMSTVYLSLVFTIKTWCRTAKGHLSSISSTHWSGRRFDKNLAGTVYIQNQICQR